MNQINFIEYRLRRLLQNLDMLINAKTFSDYEEILKTCFGSLSTEEVQCKHRITEVIKILIISR